MCDCIPICCTIKIDQIVLLSLLCTCILNACRNAAMTEWIPKWTQNGWKTYGGQDVKNKEDLIRLNELCQRVKVNWVSLDV